MIRLSSGEVSIMQIIWKKGSATSFEILDEVKLRDNISEISVRTLLARLVKKKAITVSDKNGKTYTYKPLFNRQNYIKMETDWFLTNIYENDVFLYMKHLVKEKRLSKEVLLKVLEEMDKMGM